MESAVVPDNFRVAEVSALLAGAEWEGRSAVPDLPDRRTELGREIAGLYEAHAANLRRYARGLVSAEQTASDAVQEAFLRYLVARRNGRAIEGQKAWLFRVLRNLLLDWKKQAGAAAETTMDAALRTCDARPDPETACRQSEMLRRFEHRLSPRELDCLRLRLAGLNHREIAEVLGITTGAVGTLLSRIQKKTVPA